MVDQQATHIHIFYGCEIDNLSKTVVNLKNNQYNNLCPRQTRYGLIYAPDETMVSNPGEAAHNGVGFFMIEMIYIV